MTHSRAMRKACRRTKTPAVSTLPAAEDGSFGQTLRTDAFWEEPRARDLRQLFEARRAESGARRRAASPLRAFCFAQWLAKTVDLSHPETLDVGFEAESSTFRSSDVGWACFFALSLALSRCLWPLAPSLFIASLSRGANWWPVGSPAPSGTVALDHRQGLRMSADRRRVGVLKAPGARNLKLTAPIQHQASA